MDVYLLYFTLYGHDPTAFTSWGAIVVEDGEMESFVGSSSTEMEALLDGLTKCLEQIPSILPIVIRSKHRTVLQLGKRWLEAWRSDGWESEIHSDLISTLLDLLETRRVEWFSPNYLDHLDKTVEEYALEEWNFQLESNTIDAPTVDQTLVESQIEVENSGTEVHPPDTLIILDGSVDSDSSLTSYVDTSTPIQTEPEKTSSHMEIDSSVEQNLSDVVNDVLQNEWVSLESDSKSIPPLSKAYKKRKAPFAINPDDQAQYPYVDDDGWRQLNTLFDPPFEQIEQRPPSRIVAYVSASHHQDLASWSFALIDKPSQTAFFKAVGHRHSTLNRALLQGCIALLSALKSASHHVECRLDNIDLVTLLQQLIANPHAFIEDDVWMMESAFVSQLSYWIEQRSVTVEYVGDDESDLARQMVQYFSQQRLDALNYGDSAEFSLRRTRFPLDRLKD